MYTLSLSGGNLGLSALIKGIKYTGLKVPKVKDTFDFIFSQNTSYSKQQQQKTPQHFHHLLITKQQHFSDP